MSNLLIPSYAQGFAPRDGPPAYPGLWQNLQGLWVPTLGPTGLTLYDWSGYGNDGTLTNMDPATDWVTSRLGWVNDYAGDDDVVVLSKGVMDYATPKTFAMWFKAGSIGQFRMLANVKDTASEAHRLWMQTNEIGFSVYNGLAFTSASTAFTDTTQWHHLVGTHDGGASVLGYLDGVPMGGNTDRGGGGAVSKFYIGGDADNSDYFDGLIGPVQTWSRVLASSGIQQLYTDPHALTRLRRRVYPAAAAGGYTVPLSHILECAG